MWYSGQIFSSHIFQSFYHSFITKPPFPFHYFLSTFKLTCLEHIRASMNSPSFLRHCVWTMSSLLSHIHMDHACLFLTRMLWLLIIACTFDGKRKISSYILHSYFVFNWLVIHMHVLVFFLSTVLWTINNHIIYRLINCGRWTYV
jgi:hypothetical protein